MHRKNIGIIGGMGPLATCDLMKKMILLTDAGCDQEYPHILVDCNTEIPDRTKYILGGGENPLVQMELSAARLEKMGADLLCMPCNTAHFFYDRLQADSGVPVIHMIEETLKVIQKCSLKRVGLLATKATVDSGLYTGCADKYGVEIITPDEAGQSIVTDLIYQGVKAANWSYDTGRFEEILDQMECNGAESFILGCTELPVAFESYGLRRRVIDPTMILARAAVVKAGFKVDRNQVPDCRERRQRLLHYPAFLFEI